MNATVTQTAGAPPARSASQWAFLIVGSAFAVVAIAYGVISVISLLSYRSTTEVTTYSGEVRRVVLDVAGQVRIVAVDSTETTVERRSSWSLRSPQVSEFVNGGTLTITARCGFGFAFGCDSDFRLQVPQDVAIEARSTADDVIVSGLSGDVVARSSAGDVEARNLSGRARLSSSAGDVRGANLRSAEVNARSSAGDVELRFDAAPTSIQADSSAGDVEIRVPEDMESYRVDAVSRAGDVTTNVRTDPASNRTLDLRSSAGDVIVVYGS